MCKFYRENRYILFHKKAVCDRTYLEGKTMDKKNNAIDMSQGPILVKILKFTIPLMCSSILQILFNATDIVVVGKFAGDESLAAVGSNSSLVNLLANVFVGLSVGANVIVARYIGAKDNKNVNESVHTAITLGFISGIFLTIMGIIGAPFFLRLMQTPESVLPKAVLYLRIYFLGMTAVMVYNFGSAVLRAVGDTKRPLFYLLFSGLLNVILNLIFVIFFKWDVAGVAFATIISQILSAVLVVKCLINEKSVIALSLKKLKIEWHKLYQIIKVGLPAGFQGVVFSMSNTVIQTSINSFGAIVMAGNAAANNIEGIVYFAMNAFCQATISFVSQCYGAKQYNRITKIVVTSQACVLIAAFLTGGVILLFDKELIGIYSSNSQVVDAALIRLWSIIPCYFLCGMMDVMVGGLRGIGYSVTPMIVSLVGACGLRLLWISTIFQIPAFHTQKTVYMSYPVSWAITLSVHIICYIIFKRKLNKSVFHHKWTNCGVSKRIPTTKYFSYTTQMIDSSKPIAALFDLDGVILDTESQYTIFWDSTGEKYLNKSGCGKILKGMSLELIFDTFFSTVKDKTPTIVQELNDFEASMQMNYIAGAKEFVQELKANGVKTAVVTSSNRPKMQSVYRQKPEIKELFDEILTAELFTRSKPAPDCYLLGAKTFNTCIDNCFVFEDSINGLKAGYGAKMTVVGLATTNPVEAIKEYCAITIPDFKDFSYEKLINLKKQ